MQENLSKEKPPRFNSLTILEFVPLIMQHDFTLYVKKRLQAIVLHSLISYDKEFVNTSTGVAVSFNTAFNSSIFLRPCVFIHSIAASFPSTI